MITNNFIKRHIGIRENDLPEMLKAIGVDSLEQLIDETIPAHIRLDKPLSLPKGMSEYAYLEHLKKLGAKNKLYRSYLGMGYYRTITPPVIQRNLLENPGWYTAYTPYQAEISQGRLEALLNFQTMVSDLTAMPIANASLLDEGTAAAEAMIMLYNARPRADVKAGKNKFLICNELFPQTVAILKTRSEPLGIKLEMVDAVQEAWDESCFGMILQYPDQFGAVKDYREVVDFVHERSGKIVVAADLLSLSLLKPPGEWGADVVIGSTQRFGVPMGYGGPHAAYFATTEDFKRYLPGRIIGVSVDAAGKKALRMALQTREQHIKRERATSNICTAQALLASMAGMYAVYHGKEGLQEIANEIHKQTVALEKSLHSMGFVNRNEFYFDTLMIEMPETIQADNFVHELRNYQINLRLIDSHAVGISLDETTTTEELQTLIRAFAELTGHKAVELDVKPSTRIPQGLKRTSDFLTHEVFQQYHSETEMMRYLKKLENRDLGLNRTMIPLGSCTMKLNASAQLFSLTWPEFASLHPFVPKDQAEGYQELISELEKDLCEITGFSALSFQPNSGASGEHTGLLVIKAYHEANGDHQRKICLIPSSAHGTNPASAVMAGMTVVVVKCDDQGNIDVSDLKAKSEKYASELAALMVTYPSTHGVFEEDILDIIDTVHRFGGQVYMDGANMNAQVGLTSPARIGADVCHLNLHKTFAIPHGGGGPGVGPIGVAAHLVEFLPSHPIINTGGEQAIGSVASAPFGSALILPVSYGYIKLLGADGLTDSTRYAILNANYLLARLKDHFKILYTGKKGHCAHEMILDCNAFSKSANVQVADIAKRLMDFGIHAPTVAFPVHGTLMVEPTESENLKELDRFADAMIQIREEIEEISTGQVSDTSNVIKNAPHTFEMLVSESWPYDYSRAKACLTDAHSGQDKYFTPVTRIDDAHGDRNLICTCNPVAMYEEAV